MDMGCFLWVWIQRLQKFWFRTCCAPRSLALLQPFRSMDPPWLQAACIGETLKMRLLTLKMGLYTLKMFKSIAELDKCIAPFAGFPWWAVIPGILYKPRYVYDTLSIHLTTKKICSTEIMSLKGGTKNWTTNICHSLLLPTCHTFFSQSIRGLQISKGRNASLTRTGTLGILQHING